MLLQPHRIFPGDRCLKDQQQGRRWQVCPMMGWWGVAYAYNFAYDHSLSAKRNTTAPRDMALSKSHFIRKSIVTVSIIYFACLYIIARIPKSYHSAYEEFYDATQLSGPLRIMFVMSPQAYILFALSLSMLAPRIDERAIRTSMRLWSVLFVVGSAWTALFIYAIENS